MSKILVVGGYDTPKERDSDKVKDLAQHIGKEVVKQGHVLLSGCKTEFDRDVMEGAYGELEKADPANINTQMKSYVRKGGDPISTKGTLIKSEVSSWDPADGVDIIPEPIDQADVLVFVRGYQGVNRAALWAELTHTPMLPIATYGGASRRLYQREKKRLEDRYEGRIDMDTFELLNKIPDDHSKFANEVVSLAERVLTSRIVSVMMSYTLEDSVKDNLLNTYKNVCEKYSYDVEPVTELTADEGIVQAIHKKIRHAAFVLADFTDLKPNVFYEFGVARGMRKPHIVTAQEGTELPFDVKDVPTLYWEGNWADLQDKLEQKITAIAQNQGRAL